MPLVLAGALVAGLTGGAQATPIIGNLGMFGSFTPVDADGVPTSLASATGLDFAGDVFRVVSGDGSFAGLVGSDGTIQDVQFVGFAGPLAGFWTVGDYSFRLDSLAIGFTPDPNRFLSLGGEGLISDGDGHTAAGQWVFTGNGLGGVFSWSGGAVSAGPPAGVPEPAGWSLAILGLAGLVATRRSRGASVSN